MYHLIISAPARGSLVDRPSPTILRCHSVGTKRHCSALVAALAADEGEHDYCNYQQDQCQAYAARQH